MRVALRHRAMDTMSTQVERLLEARQRQGLPAHVEDPEVLRKAASLLREGKEEVGGDPKFTN